VRLRLCSVPYIPRGAPGDYFREMGYGGRVNAAAWTESAVKRDSTAAHNLQMPFHSDS